MSIWLTVKTNMSILTAQLLNLPLNLLDPFSPYQTSYVLGEGR